MTIQYNHESNWKWVNESGLTLNFLTDSGLEFEFDNTDAYTANISKVETGDYQLPNNDFVATITYFDGNGEFNASLESHILSGLNSVNSELEISKEMMVTIPSRCTPNEGNSFLFEGDIEG